MIVHGRVEDPDRGLDDPPVLVATIAGSDLVTLAALSALQEDYLVWRATSPEQDERDNEAGEDDR